MSTSAFTLRDGRLTATKDPQATLRYWRDVSGLLAEGDAISTVTADAAGVSVTGTPTHENGVIEFVVAGGTLGKTGSVTLQWTTTGGDIDERTVWFDIQER